MTIGRKSSGWIARVLPSPVCESSMSAILSFATQDGAFCGRAGGADLYYTRFALMALEGLGRVDSLNHLGSDACHNDKKRRVPKSRTLLSQMFEDVFYCKVDNIIDHLCRIESADILIKADSSDRLENVNYAKYASVLRDAELFVEAKSVRKSRSWLPFSPESGLYDAFLSSMVLTYLPKCTMQAESILRFLEKRQNEDGGFCEQLGAEASQTNATCAALGLMFIAFAEMGNEAQIFGNFAGLELYKSLFDNAIDWLINSQREDGGFAATADSPESDMLSTFSAVFCLDAFGYVSRINGYLVAGCVKSLMLDGGGFRSTFSDSDTDVEYIYYGLASLAILLAQVVN